MRPDKIVIRGAREHNLKNVTVEIPRDQLVCLTGVSGSGKSSLAFDTLYAEGQRRYVESLSSYARQFLGTNQKPLVDYIGGLSPAISIEQKTASRNPRSTVGTVTEIHDYLRVLYARVGEPHCPSCGRRVQAQTVEQIVDQILSRPAESQWLILAPVARNRKGTYEEVFTRAKKDGFARVRVNGQVRSLDEKIVLNKKLKHQIDIVVDRVRIAPADEEVDRTRLADSVETALRFGEGTLVLAPYSADAPGREAPQSKKGGGESGGGLTGMSILEDDILFSEKNACVYCGLSFDALSPQMFSFNSPIGACPDCLGLGSTMEVDADLVVPEKTKTLREGAIVTWGEQDDDNTQGSWGEQYRAQVLQHYGISPDVPWKKLTSEQQKALLYGSSGERIKITWKSKDGRSNGSWFSKWEGAIPRIKRRLKQTGSDSMREHYLQFFGQRECSACHGEKLKPEARAVTVGGTRLPDLERMSIAAACTFFQTVQLPQREQLIAQELLKEILGRLQFLMNVGLHYLTLDRAAPSLSGGEAQRIRLASQIGCGLVGVLYILDEPSIGLHQRDNGKLIRTLEDLRDIGNTVVVVEHDLDTMLAADYLIDFGPGAGVNGGHVVASGTPREVAACKESLTGQYLAGTLEIPVPAQRRSRSDKWLTVRGAREHNLKGIDARFPLERLVVVTGVSGSGKSSLVNEILYKSLERDLMRAQTKPGAHDSIEGVDHLDKIIAIDQDPIGRTPRSNPATYVGVYDDIRGLFAQVPESKIRGYKPGRFSFNVKGGRCEACQGDGLKRIEMQFLADVFVPCEVCKGKRFNRETLEVRFKGKTITEVLEMTIDEAAVLFENVPAVSRILQTMRDVGLGYMSLGQPAPTLSGGEAQRVKLAKELCRPSTGRTLYVLDEPTTGLHFADIKKLLDVLQRLVEGGNSVVVIEHNLDVIKTADWIVDLGPEGGEGGGRVLAEGTPEKVARSAQSFTGEFLRQVLKIGLPSTNGRAANGHPAVDAPDRMLAITPESLRELRLSLKLSQAEAAQVVGVSRGLLAEAERGRRTGERTLTRIALGLRSLAERVSA
ncbi:MAG TPA: excinuclease ABC subunit UvrA [Chloroflexota bacterium]|nr:excinuclease ABC subunit UvrA [Chloroflexota bacterium]